VAPNHEYTLDRMQAQLQKWEQATDRRTIFLSCYVMMTRNMLAALQDGFFIDSSWVLQLLDHFADYYFHALEAYESGDLPSHEIWKFTFDASNQEATHTLQNLLLGVNAHISYDLVLALADGLEPEWSQLSSDQRSMRYQDHCRVNEVIARTIDAVQAEILDKHSLVMEVVDVSMGRMDEWLVSKLIAHWRDQVWNKAVQRVETASEEERESLRREEEALSLERGRIILLNWKGIDLESFL
jgi:hypothetical protein